MIRSLDKVHRRRHISLSVWFIITCNELIPTYLCISNIYKNNLIQPMKSEGHNCIAKGHVQAMPYIVSITI